MNYQKIYDAIIANAQNRNIPNVYTEMHHILPRSLGGSDDTTNLISLTAKEHFICHHLLWKIHKNREMTKAFMLMTSAKRNGIKFRVTASTYQKLKEETSQRQREFMTGKVSPNKGKKISEETRIKMSESQKGHGRGNGGSKGFTGKHWTQEQKDAISARRKGVATRTGIPFTQEVKDKMSADRKGKKKVPWTEERKAARKEMMRQLWEKRRQEKSSD